MAWIIDPAHTSVNFSVKHMMFATVHGSFKEFSGTIVLNEDDPTESYVEGSVQTDSIDTGVADRDNHLRSVDFFEVENYPTMTFRSSEIEQLSKDEYKVTGNLTIRDVTRPVTWRVNSLGQGTDPFGNYRWGVNAETRINRKEFGLTWNQALESGGWLVGDTINITADVQLIETEDEAEASEEREAVTA